MNVDWMSSDFNSSVLFSEPLLPVLMITRSDVVISSINSNNSTIDLLCQRIYECYSVCLQWRSCLSCYCGI